MLSIKKPKKLLKFSPSLPFLKKKKVQSQQPITKTKKRFVPIKRQLITICILFAIVPLLIINTLSSSIAKSTLRETSQHLTEQMLHQASLNITSFTSQVEKNLTQFIVVDLLQSNLLAQYFSTDTLTMVKAVSNIQKQMIYLQSLDNTISNVAIICSDNKMLGKIPSLTTEDLALARELQVGNRCTWKKGLGTNEKALFLIRDIQYAGSTTGNTCTFVAEINQSIITSILDSIELLDNANLTLLDTEKNLIYNSNPETTAFPDDLWSTISTTAELTSIEQDNLLTTFTTLDNSWKLVSEVPVVSLTQRLNLASRLIWFLVLVLGLLAILVGSQVANSFSKPIINLMQLMKKAEEGDLTVHMLPKGNNEVTQLCNSFNYMITNIRTLLEQTQVVIAQTLENSQLLTNSTRHSVDTFSQLATSVEDIAKGTAVQAEDAHLGSLAMSNLALSIQRLLEKSHQIYEKNQGAKVLIQKATQSMSALNTSTTSSTQIASSIGTSIMELSQLNKGIESMMQLVDGISEQTNLLALNASIEAARAGDAGRGFAVVAQQVRNLSEQSKESTVKVRQTLNEIGQKNTSTTKLIDRSNTIFSDQVVAVEEVSSSFTSIIDTLKVMETELNEINNQLEDMEQLKEATLLKIANIASITQESAASTEEVSALSEEQKHVIEQLLALSHNLTTSMTSLNESIQTFKLK
ncbi:hypothetical protein CS063_00860 [Sporanaerobium hydrogeniformans]|uniref:Uncharacterized protein n=1 Tax=Sporanaerobium hydrogeniformans TaxID=3072179 RepID=A0AC61DFT9_9FIRM|nr:methyl-accepting chemotaxis protein [Sporanaerobium hydrogeniformans]PHV72061.1 hypothetical protein CS063_00860 [Sporanaerobium hydrogeniformans]